MIGCRRGQSLISQTEFSQFLFSLFRSASILEQAEQKHEQESILCEQIITRNYLNLILIADTR